MRLKMLVNFFSILLGSSFVLANFLSSAQTNSSDSVILTPPSFPSNHCVKFPKLRECIKKWKAFRKDYKAFFENYQKQSCQLNQDRDSFQGSIQYDQDNKYSRESSSSDNYDQNEHEGENEYRNYNEDKDYNDENYNDENYNEDENYNDEDKNDNVNKNEYGEKSYNRNQNSYNSKNSNDSGIFGDPNVKEVAGDIKFDVKRESQQSDYEQAMY